MKTKKHWTQRPENKARVKALAKKMSRASKARAHSLPTKPVGKYMSTKPIRPVKFVCPHCGGPVAPAQS